MHYIRFCRPPKIWAGRPYATVNVVLTITTDLSDAFLSPRNPIELAVIGAYTEHKDGKDRIVPVVLTQGNPPLWKAGMRVLKLDLPLPLQPIETIQIRPLNRQLTAMGTSDVLPGNQGLIMAVYADIPRPGDGGAPSVCFRSLRLSTGDMAAGVMAPQPLQIEEDLGESIARHIWDSGIVMVSLLADMCLDSTASAKERLPLFRSILQTPSHPLRILELGCGVGVMGIGLARIMSLKSTGGAPHILITDLPEAEEKARANMARQADKLGDTPARLDFEALDWEDGKNGVFGEKAASRPWDLVVLCDCTYNTDTLPPLVKTLSALHSRSAQHPSTAGPPTTTEVLVATKTRHSSEKAFFNLMAEDGWAIREQTVLPLPVLDGEGQTVEVYLFGKAGC
ncbi:putative methyltransferase-domain-containing protein [Chaetomium fimeti]|uniref:Methyltransferase-domain-containing protein n=1 Tax=Chaetomium fimeti TaxID=1854472 RepID=A0AAE0H9J7_9PEZI|nr:putative methyltransferase-domain-containing protein [Chaetomium fimeti]